MDNGSLKHSKHNAVILLAPGIEEDAVTYLAKRLRSQGIQSTLVSQSAGLVSGEYGLAIRPDRCLSELEDTYRIRLVVVPGNARCASRLLADPRVHRLFWDVLDQGGQIAIMTGAEPAFMRAGLLELMADPGCLLQGGRGEDDFSTSLIHLMEG